MDIQEYNAAIQRAQMFSSERVRPDHQVKIQLPNGITVDIGDVVFLSGEIRILVKNSVPSIPVVTPILADDEEKDSEETHEANLRFQHYNVS